MYKGQIGGQRSWSVGSKVERFKMSQKCGWEPDHVGRTLEARRRHLDLTLNMIGHKYEGFMKRSDRNIIYILKKSSWPIYGKRMVR